MHLVQDDHLQALQRRAVLVEHVAEDLGGHDHDGSLGVDRVVSGQETDPGLAVPAPEVSELLVRQGLEGRRVEGLPMVGQGPFHGELGDDGLARAGGCRHQHGLPGLQRLGGPDLVVVQGERVSLGEALDGGHSDQYRWPS